jgi:signal transduction histidine kinase
VLFHEMLVPIRRGGRLDDAWWSYSYSPLFDDEGAIAGVLVVATETTAEVRGRKQLEAAKMEAEAANNAKDEFLAVVSHELRNPLNAILGWSRMLQTVTDPSRVSKGLAVIDRNATAQAKLIDDILDVSRIVTGKLVLDLRKVSVATIVHNAVESIRPAFLAKKLQFSLDAVGADIHLVADADRLQQIIWNLLSNAAKFTPEGGAVRLNVRQADAKVHVRVSDTGRGIEPAFLPFVFDRFRQADASTTKRHGGLGLGLAIVRNLVELHGGTIEAASEGEGRGTTVEIILPVRAVEPRGGPGEGEGGGRAEMSGGHTRGESACFRA